MVSISTFHFEKKCQVTKDIIFRKPCKNDTPRMRPCKTTHLTSTNDKSKNNIYLKKNRLLGLPHGTPAGTLLSLGGISNPSGLSTQTPKVEG